jgi:hypothetical protein
MSIPQPVEKLDSSPSLASDARQKSLQQLSSNDTPHEHDFEWLDLIRIGFVVLAAAAVWFRVWEPFSRISVIGILATVIGVEALRIARRCRGVIMQNFVGTLVVDSIGVGMAAFGFLDPLLAAFIHVTSELAFILNSTKLLPRGSKMGR